MPETNCNLVKLLAHYYEQLDADYSLAVPAEGYGGWKSTEVEIYLEHIALVVMHAWDTGTNEVYPGWYRHAVAAVENKETARQELGKQIALWRVGLEFGFALAFDVGEFIDALHALPKKR